MISGSGNVATHAAEKIVQLGGKVLTLSDSEGFVHDPDGIDQEKIDWVKAHKTRRRGRICEYADEYKNATFHAGKRPWGVECDVALPCATQNELLGDDARTLVTNGCIAVSEGANMPTDLEGVHVFKDAKLLYAPGKASNAGGVAVSGLEMSQNSGAASPGRRTSSSGCSKDIMDGIHTPLPRIWRPRRRLYRLCEGRQHRRLQEGGGRDAGLRGGLSAVRRLRARLPARQRICLRSIRS